MAGRESTERAGRAYADARLSPQRRAILAAVEAFPGAFTVDELDAAAKRLRPGLATATVYRAVAALLDSGHVARVGTQGEAALYARCGTDDHHHHAVCESCGALVCVECPADPTAEIALAGFEVRRHEFRVYGLCASCALEGDDS